MTQTQSRKKNLFQMNVDLMHGPISVSYTHLDVYKRQSWNP